MKRGSTVRDVLESLPACQITSIPRPGGDSGPDTAQAQRVAAMAAAWHAAPVDHPAVIAAGWVRRADGGPVELLAAGHLLAGDRDGQEVLLTLPAGARGQLLPPGALPRLLETLPWWQPVSGLADGVLADPGVNPPALVSGIALEEYLLPAWTRPFGWLIIAQALPPATVAELADEAARVAHATAITADRFPERGPQARRMHLRHAELRRGLTTGMWRLHIAAGGVTPHDAARVAGLACGTPGLAGLPYLIAPASQSPSGISEILSAAPAAPRSAGDIATGFPFNAGSDLAGALSRPPATEIPGVRLTLRPTFDTTPEHPSPAGGHGAGIAAGQVLDRSLRPAGPFTLPLASLNRHVFVSGATGAGKSQTVRGLLEAATAAGIPWLVIEPAKAEYQLMAARLAPAGHEVIRIRPGDPDAIPAGLNPLEPAPGPDGTRFPLQTHADLTRALFLAAFRAEEPFPQVLAAALARAYDDAGWDLVLGEPARGRADPGYPGLGALQRAAEQVVTEIGYSQRVTDDVLGFIRVRLTSLRHGTTGRFLDGGHPLDFGELLTRNVVLEIEDVGDDQDKAFLMGAMLIRLTEHLRLTRPAGRAPAAGLAHLTVVEEAHRLLRRPQAGHGGAAEQATEMFAGLLAEIRAYGEGLIIAEQIPARLIPDAIKNTAVKITHRLPAADDREALGATMNMTGAQSRYLVTLPPGQAAVFTDGMDHPVLVQMPDGTAHETAHAPAAAPSAVVRPRSTTCGSHCTARPCTLRQMRQAQSALGRAPALTLWAELTVLGHLTGWAMPVPRTLVLDRVRAAPKELRDCAISHAVDAAVAGRSQVLADQVSPHALARHAADAIRACLDREEMICAAEERHWLATAFQWAPLLDALTEAYRAEPKAGRHPRTREWELAYGRTIPGSSISQQTAAVQGWHDHCQRDPATLRTLAFGSSSPSPVEQALGASRTAGDFTDHLHGQLRHFTRCDWPVIYLTELAAHRALRKRYRRRLWDIGFSDDFAVSGEIPEFMHHREGLVLVGDLPGPEAEDLAVVEQDDAVVDHGGNYLGDPLGGLSCCGGEVCGQVLG